MFSKKGNDMSVEGLMLDTGMDPSVDRDIQMYGMSTKDINDQYMNSITAKCSGLEMVVMGILSDCQEMMAMKNPTIPSPKTDDYVRKQMNVAKYILCEMMDQKEKA